MLFPFVPQTVQSQEWGDSDTEADDVIMHKRLMPSDEWSVREQEWDDSDTEADDVILHKRLMPSNERRRWPKGIMLFEYDVPDSSMFAIFSSVGISRHVLAEIA